MAGLRAVAVAVPSLTPPRSAIIPTCLAATLALGACSLFPRERTETEVPRLDAAFVAVNSSAPGIAIAAGRVLADNDDAFETKLALVRGARESVDLAYYIYADDHSSSLLSRELVAATRRGVDVRLLLDYHSHYEDLDRFLMLEREGNAGSGSLRVRFYGRPSRNIVEDAVYLTLGCGEAKAGDKSGCGEAKFARVERAFAREDGTASTDEISNLVTSGSGLFLSGLYAKNPNLMALAVSEGQAIDVETLREGGGETDPAALEKLKELGKLYWFANYGGGLDRLVNRLKLNAAFLFYGDEVDPVYDTFSAYLPVERPGPAADARRDWDHLTDFLHHKLLLVDRRQLVLGGRNVEDAYHMRPNPLSAKYTFMDVDVRLELETGGDGVARSFARLWDFGPMVARLDEVRAHAPNDFLVASRAADAACEPLEGGEKEAHRVCVERELERTRGVPLAARLDAERETMLARARRYERDYSPAPAARREPSWPVDRAATLHYFENLPFDYADGEPERSGMREARVEGRAYGAVNGAETESGKHLSALWLAAMARVCESARDGERRRIYLHNAYFFLPSNLLARIARMVDGRLPCANVDLVVLTNSIETTDLNVVNLLSGHALQALFEHYGRHHDPERGATLAYHEHLPEAGEANRSLHAKVAVFGDDVVVGSANADFRSYLMDTNNGVLIREAPRLRDAYVAWLERLLADPARTTRRDARYADVSREAMLAEGDALVDATLAKYRAERFVDDPARIEELKGRLRELCDAIYRLGGEVVAGGDGARAAEQRLDAMFKTI